MAQQLRSRRFETRLDAHTDDLITQAAQLAGQSRSAFVVQAAKLAAERIVSPTEKMTAQDIIATLSEGLSPEQVAACPLLRANAN
ncbi:MAG: DUF1778 domain-containing protein [Propionibacteriaceae bacterium]|jgi:uncharacterized protein (DUF1778 family)|nr:DUF1778 domain-containing protein [Propionibacteriaceae bacterium]